MKKDKKRIIILGNTGNNVNSCYSWFCRTVNQGMKLNGHDVIGFDYKSHSIEQIRDFLFEYGKDAIVFTHLTFHHHKPLDEILEVFDSLRSLHDTKIIHTMQDARNEPRYKGDISFAFDCALIAQTQNIKKFQKYWNIPVYYWPYSSMTYEKMGTYRPELDFRKPVFPGNPTSHPDRSAFIKKLQQVMDIKIIQTKSPEDIRERTLDFSVSSPCVLGLCTGYDNNLYGYNEVRWAQYGGCGALLIMRDYPCNKDIFPEGLYFGFDSYNDPMVVKEYWEKIKKMKDKEKMKMRNDVFNFIQKHHSCKVRMKQTIEVIEGKREKLDIFLNELDI